MVIDGLLYGGFLHVDDLALPVSLVAELRDLNDRLEIPCAWLLSAGSTDLFSSARVRLKVGIHGGTGALMWISRGQFLVPATGTNPDWQVYYLAGLHDMYLPPHAEVPVETAYQALAEFLVTRARPTCVEWQEAELD